MFQHVGKLFMIFATFISICFMTTNNVSAKNSDPILLDDSTKKEDMYSAIEIIKDRKRALTIDDVVSGSYDDNFLPAHDIRQKKGFFETANWLRFEVNNQTNQRDWLLEFAFPLINEIEIYTVEDGEIQLLHKAGSDLPFKQRSIEHRHFVFNLEVEHGKTKTFYALAVGSGDLHPPISIWNQEAFIEKTQNEFVLLGIFYGVILVMILYNLFLYFSLRLKSYLYYVIAITFTLLGKLSINGLGFQYLWPNAPAWNLISAPVWVPLACIFILIFSRSFLDLDRYFPKLKHVFYVLITCNVAVFIALHFSNYFSRCDYFFKTWCTSSAILYRRLVRFFYRCIDHYDGKSGYITVYCRN